LAFVLRVTDAIVEGRRIDVQGSVVELGGTRFTGTYFLRHLTITRAVSSSGPFSLGANADIRFGDGVALAADVEWSGPVLGEDAAGRASLTGDYPVLALHHELSAPFSASTDGTPSFPSAMRLDLPLPWRGLGTPGRQ